MNPNNYGTLEACKRLIDAGIVLETDCYHKYHSINGCFIVSKEEHDDYIDDIMRGKKSMFDYLWCPTPSMAEVWRELPDSKELLETKGCNYASVILNDKRVEFSDMGNPTDALIDLLIWVRKEGKSGPRRLLQFWPDKPTEKRKKKKKQSLAKKIGESHE
jgi:hypothetical protein